MSDRRSPLFSSAFGRRVELGRGEKGRVALRLTLKLEPKWPECDNGVLMQATGVDADVLMYERVYKARRNFISKTGMHLSR